MTGDAQTEAEPTPSLCGWCGNHHLGRCQEYIDQVENDVEPPPRAEDEEGRSCTCGLQAGPLLGQMHTCCRAGGHPGGHICRCGAGFHLPEIAGEPHDAEAP